MNQVALGNSRQFIELTDSIRKTLPRTYFYGIIGSYTINAVMIGFFIFPSLEKMIGYWAALIISAVGTSIIQTFRGLIVFTDLLFAESGQNSKLQVKIVALLMTLVGVFELWHLLSGFTSQINPSEIIGVFVFGSSIIVGGWMMEINFIKQTNEYIYQTGNFLKRNRAQNAPTRNFQNNLGMSDESLKENRRLNSGPSSSQKNVGISESSLRKSEDQKAAELRAHKQEIVHLQSLLETTAIEKADLEQQKAAFALKEKELKTATNDISDFDAKYNQDLKLEEQLATDYDPDKNEPLELNLEGNFSQNGHH